MIDRDTARGVLRSIAAGGWIATALTIDTLTEAALPDEKFMAELNELADNRRAINERNAAALREHMEAIVR